LLSLTSLKENEYVIYKPEKIKYKSIVYRGVSSLNFLNDGWEIITLERLFKNYYGKSLHEAIWTIHDPKERLKFIVENVEKITGLKEFGKYMNKLLTIDCLFLNEDRHTHNIAVLTKNNEYAYCPIFDNGAGLLSDTTMDYPIGEDIYKQIDFVKAKTISLDFKEQMEVSEQLYGMNLKPHFTKKDVDKILDSDEALIYSKEERDRVRTIIYEQIRKFPYLF
jgi:hypothetical protein